MKDESAANVTSYISITPSSIETVDTAMFNWLDHDLDLRCESNKGFIKPPVIWTSAERAFLTKKDRKTRGKDGNMNFPLISLERVSIVKDLQKKGSIWGNIFPVNDEKGGSFTIGRLVQQDKSTNFVGADNKAIVGQINFPRKNTKIVYQTFSIPLPVYVEVTYDIHLRTIYQQQMNTLLTPFITRTGGINAFLIHNEDLRYEAFIEKDFKSDSNMKDMGTEERKFETTVTVRVLGYLIGDEKNQIRPRVAVRENAVDVKFARERIITSDNNEIKNSDGFVGLAPIIGRKKG